LTRGRESPCVDFPLENVESVEGEAFDGPRRGQWTDRVTGLLG
jgi:hypothetical protein